jgi:histidinol dehydrogenase
MKTILNPERTSWTQLCQRPSLELEFLESAVRNILNRVRSSGDAALLEFALQFDRVELDALQVSSSEIAGAARMLKPELKSAIELAASNIERFHRGQARSEPKIETMVGVTCWRKAVPVERVGIYIPGGTAPLFSTVLMLAIPARIAGCSEVILCTPPRTDGTVAPEILFAAAHAGVSQVFKVGGAQAIAAMAFGTESIPAVDKIFGPGNQYVTKAKQMVNQHGTAVDLPAGPSELLVVADDSAQPAYVAADLLSQAEHGVDSQVVLVTPDKGFVPKVEAALRSQLASLPRKEIAEGALQNSLAVVFEKSDHMMDFVNQYAPEHLIFNCRNFETLATGVRNAGSVFLGQWSPESAGDYASGTNHTLPTNGHARAYSGVSLESFQKLITFQQLTESGLRNLGPAVMLMAEAEGLMAHRNSINVRITDL